MRPFILISALLVFARPAVAQNWQEYSYPDHSFRVTFPADPQIEVTTYRVTDDRQVEAHVYFVRRDDAEFNVTVAELADAGLELTAVIDYAIKTLSKGGVVKINLPHHIMSVFGRQLSIVEGDGSRVAVGLFAYHRRLYQIEGKSLRAGNDATADTLRLYLLGLPAMAARAGAARPCRTGGPGRARPRDIKALPSRKRVWHSTCNFCTLCPGLTTATKARGMATYGVSAPRRAPCSVVGRRDA